MIERISALALVLLGVFTVFCAVQSCTPKGQTLKFASPPAENHNWQKKFVAWPHIPIRIRVEKGPMQPALLRDASLSADAWNRVIGCTVLELSTDVDAEIVVSLEPKPNDREWAGSAKFVRRTFLGYKYWGSNIYIYKIYYNNDLYRYNLMAHELGHALGLDDIKDSESLVMHWEISSGNRVNKEVVRLLNKLYCGAP